MLRLWVSTLFHAQIMGVHTSHIHALSSALHHDIEYVCHLTASDATPVCARRFARKKYLQYGANPFRRHRATDSGLTTMWHSRYFCLIAEGQARKRDLSSPLVAAAFAIQNGKMLPQGEILEGRRDAVSRQPATSLHAICRCRSIAADRFCLRKSLKECRIQPGRKFSAPLSRYLCISSGAERSLHISFFSNPRIIESSH